MTPDFPEALRGQARQWLTAHCPPERVRRVAEGKSPYDGALWLGMAELGWLGATIPEEYGGTGLGYYAQCVLAEEIGRVAASVPFASSACMATEAILLAGSPAQKRSYLAGFAAGMHIGTLAWAEGAENPRPAAFSPILADGKLSGAKYPVPDGGSADLAIVTASDGEGRPILALADLRAGGVTRTPLAPIDPSRPQARLDLASVPAEQLGGTASGPALLERLLARSAVLIAFEQLGGASACLETAAPLPDSGSEAIAQARATAHRAARALQEGTLDLPLAAAARIAATEAFRLAAGRIAAPDRPYAQRAELLGSVIGDTAFWKDRIVPAGGQAPPD